MAHTPFSTTLTLAALSLSLSTLAFSPVMTEVDGRAIPEIEWETTLAKFGLDKDKFLGQRFTAKCPKTSQKAGEDKSGVYASTYSICQAAFDAGAIDNKGGAVTVQVNPGSEIHTGNPKLTTARTMSVIGKGNLEATDKVYRDNIQRIKWDSKFTKSIGASKHLIGQQFTFECPAAPSTLPPRRIVGTDLYAFNSMTCLAALHAGVLTKDGGLVTVQMNPGKAKLVGSVRDGLKSHDGTSGLSALSFVDNPVNP